MGGPDQIGWPTLPEVCSPAVEGGGGLPSTYSTRPPPSPGGAAPLQLLQLSAAVAGHASGSCHLPRLLGPFGLLLYAGLNTAHLVLYLDTVHFGFARRSGGWPSPVPLEEVEAGNQRRDWVFTGG